MPYDLLLSSERVPWSLPLHMLPAQQFAPYFSCIEVDRQPQRSLRSTTTHPSSSTGLSSTIAVRSNAGIANCKRISATTHCNKHQALPRHTVGEICLAHHVRLGCNRTERPGRRPKAYGADHDDDGHLYRSAPRCIGQTQSLPCTWHACLCHISRSQAPLLVSLARPRRSGLSSGIYLCGSWPKNWKTKKRRSDPGYVQ